MPTSQLTIDERLDRIGEILKEHEPMPSWDEFWAELLAEYEALCESTEED